MRLLTALGGILLSSTGAFCFAFYTSRFADVAFVVGVVMMLAGLFDAIAYLISGKGEKRTTDTALVEGLVTFFYGFAILCNQVTDSTLTMFFGTWLTLCGFTRFSQSLYVSRFNPKDWSKILPLACITATLGMIMMLPWIVASVMPLMLVGGAMLFDGLSIIVYAMYMKKKSTDEITNGEAQAKARAEAKLREHQQKREEQERLRSLSREEREKEEAERRSRELQMDQEKRAKRAAERAARKEAARSDEDRTMRLTDEEVDQINEAALDSLESESENLSKPVWNRPTDIPSFRSESKNTEKKKEVDDVEISAVRLDEIENTIPIVNFEKVELPEVELASEKSDADRQDIIEKIEQVGTGSKLEMNLTEVDLEELVAEPMDNKTTPEDAVRFTQKLDFSWIEELNKELAKDKNNHE